MRDLSHKSTWKISDFALRQQKWLLHPIYTVIEGPAEAVRQFEKCRKVILWTHRIFNGYRQGIIVFLLDCVAEITPLSELSSGGGLSLCCLTTVGLKQKTLGYPSAE